MNLKEIGHTKITPEGGRANILIAGVSFIILVTTSGHIKNGTVAIFLFILLLVFFISLAQILVNIAKSLVAFSRRMVNFYLVWKNS